MSLDSSLRRALIREGEPIHANAEVGLAAVGQRIRSGNKRRAAAVGGVVLAIVAIVLWPDDAASFADRRDVPPARMERTRELPERRDAPLPGRRERETHMGASQSVPRPGAAGRAAVVETRAMPRTVPAARQERTVESAVVPREESEGYVVKYVAGTHVGESAGAGCSQDEGAIAANDCVAFLVGDDESRVALDIVDDTGALVGAQIYEDYRGESVDHGVVCGAKALTVHPGALLLVYIHTGSQCSDQRPTSGHVTARFS